MTKNLKRKVDDNSNSHKRQKKSRSIEPAMSGFLIMSDRNKERGALAEALELIHFYYPQFEKNTENLSPVVQYESKADFEEQLKKELSDLNGENSLHSSINPFRMDVDCISFINCQHSKISESLPLFTDFIFKNLKKDFKSYRFLKRIIPLQQICVANLEDLQNSIEGIIESTLPVLFENHDTRTISFSVEFNRRNSDKLTRDIVIPLAAKIIKDKYPNMTVDLKNSDCTLIIEVYKNIAGISLVKSFFQNFKFNVEKITSKK